MVKKYKQFLFEWGYGGEGGAASKDPIKVRSAMLTEIDPLEAKEEEEEEEDNSDIPILSDTNESVDNEELDPYGEEVWDGDLPSYSYREWNDGIYSFLKQLKNTFIDECLAGLERVEQKDAEEWLDDILNEIEDGDYDFSSDDIRAIRDDIDDLLELCVDNEDDDRVEGPDPDEYYDRKREEEYERFEREYEDK